MRPVEEGHTQGDIFKLLIRLIQRQLQERNFLQRCGDEVPKAATNPEKFHSLHYPGRSLETLFRMDFDRICSPWCGHLGTILSWPNDMVVFLCYDATRFCIVVAHVLTLLHICNLPGLLSFLWQCAFQCHLDSSVFVFVQLQCRQSDLRRDLEAHPPMIIHHILSRFVDGGCMEIWGYIFGFPWRGLMLPVADISTINSFTRICRLSWKYTMLHKDCFARNQGLHNSSKHTSSPCKSIAT